MKVNIYYWILDLEDEVHSVWVYGEATLNPTVKDNTHEGQN